MPILIGPTAGSGDLQLVSSALFSLGHGGNDAQKVMGIIGAAIIFYEKQRGVDMSFNEFVPVRGCPLPVLLLLH